jgi:hypothetical protein
MARGQPLAKRPGGCLGAAERLAEPLGKRAAEAAWAQAEPRPLRTDLPPRGFPLPGESAGSLFALVENLSARHCSRPRGRLCGWRRPFSELAREGRRRGDRRAIQAGKAPRP